MSASPPEPALQSVNDSPHDNDEAEDLLAEARRWADAWGGTLDVEASASWHRLRAELDPVLESEHPAAPEHWTGLDDAVRDELTGLLAWMDDVLPDVRTPGTPIPAGASIGGCEIVRLIGRGGMGEVYEAIDRTLGEGLDRRVAIKIIPVDEDVAGTGRTLRRDVEALARLEHPGIARLYRAGADEGRAFVVTEFVDGDPVIAVIERLRTGDDRRRIALTLDLGERLAEAIATSHSAGVVHRDLKSSNVLVRPDGRLSVVDFGIAALEVPQVSDRGAFDDAAAVEADARGSLGAISPERARGVHSGPREDVWAIGTLLFEMATGRHPRAALLPERATVTRTLVESIGAGDVPPVRDVDPSVPGDLAAVIDRCLVVDPAERYADASAVREDLRRVRTGHAPMARRVGRWGRFLRLVRRRPFVTTLIVLLSLLLVVGSAVSLSLAITARRAESLAEARSQVVRAVADDLMTEVAASLREIPGATQARRRLLEIGLAYAESVGGDEELRGDRDGLLHLARALLTIGELHRSVQPNAAEDDLGREAFERAATLALRSAEVRGPAIDADALGLAVRAQSVAISGRPDTTQAERVEAWKDVITLADRALTADPNQADALIGRAISALRIGDLARLDSWPDEAVEWFTIAVDATAACVDAHPDLADAWFWRGATLNSMWWVLYKDFQAGNESRILDVMDEMIRAERREDELLRTSTSAANVLTSESVRIMVAIEFGLADAVDAVRRLVSNESILASMSEAEPDLGILRRRRIEGHLRVGEGLAILVDRAIARGDEADARHLAAIAARAFEDLAVAQRERLRRKEGNAHNDDELITQALREAAAMWAIARPDGDAGLE